MADDPSLEKELNEVEKSTKSISRRLAEVVSEISKARDKTNAWFDATKAVQTATESANKAAERQQAIVDKIRESNEAAKDKQKEIVALYNRNRDIGNEMNSIASERAAIDAQISSGALSASELQDKIAQKTELGRRERALDRKSVV